MTSVHVPSGHGGPLRQALIEFLHFFFSLLLFSSLSPYRYTYVLSSSSSSPEIVKLFSKCKPVLEIWALVFNVVERGHRPPSLLEDLGERVRACSGQQVFLLFLFSCHRQPHHNHRSMNQHFATSFFFSRPMKSSEFDVAFFVVILEANGVQSPW